MNYSDHGEIRDDVKFYIPAPQGVISRPPEEVLERFPLEMRFDDIPVLPYVGEHSENRWGHCEKCGELVRPLVSKTEYVEYYNVLRVECSVCHQIHFFETRKGNPKNCVDVLSTQRSLLDPNFGHLYEKHLMRQRDRFESIRIMRHLIDNGFCITKSDVDGGPEEGGLSIYRMWWNKRMIKDTCDIDEHPDGLWVSTKNGRSEILSND